MDPLARLQALLERVLPAGNDRVKLQPAVFGGPPGEMRRWVSESDGWAVVNLHLLFFASGTVGGKTPIEDVFEQEVDFVPMSALSNPLLEEFVLAWGVAVTERLDEPCPRRFMPNGLGPADPHALLGAITSSDDLRRAVATRGVTAFHG